MPEKKRAVDDSSMARHKKCLEHALEIVKMSKEEFNEFFSLWKFASTKLDLPLPRTSRLIPYVCAAWNAFKSSSDMITKLLDTNIGLVIPKLEIEMENL